LPMLFLPCLRQGKLETRKAPQCRPHS
jgi:hypothetical protein